MYKVGMYCGIFNPLHMGHLKCIIKASSLCEELHIIISYGLFKKDEINVRVRYRWLYQLTKHISNVELHILEDITLSKEEYASNRAYWDEDAIKVRAMIGKPIDVIFCGNDYNDASFYKLCYPESQIYYFERDEISSTKIRQNPYLYWDWLPNVVKPYYVKKVLLIGGESTGKSTLSINLANYYNTNYVEEVGKELYEKSGTDSMMLLEDFEEILLKHRLKIIEAAEKSNKVLFIDTDSLVTKFYLNILMKDNLERWMYNELADAISELNNYDLILFLEPDVDFVDVGRTEEIKNNRVLYSEKLKKMLTEHGLEFETISGDYFNRFNSAVALVDKLLK